MRPFSDGAARRDMGSPGDPGCVLRCGRGTCVGEVIRRIKGGRFLGFYLRFYEQGRRRVLASKQPTHAEARRMLVQIEARIARGQAGVAQPSSPAPSVATLIARFLTEYSRPRIKDLARYRAQARIALQRVQPLIGNVAADDVGGHDVARLRDALGRRYADNSVRQTLTALGVLFAWAQRLGIVAQNPVRGVELPPRVDAIDFLTTDEVRALLTTVAQQAEHSIGAQLQHVRVLLALHTGLRKGELCGLRWRDLDLRGLRLTVARSYRATPKSGKARHLRLPEAVVPALQDWHRACPSTEEGLVLPVRRRDRTWGMSTATSDLLQLPPLLRAAGLRVPAHPWHVLRHTFASHYMMNGGNLLALSKILGHSDVKVTMVYAHLAPDYIGAEMNRVKY